jgi:uncharacterized membrane protein YkoI
MKRVEGNRTGMSYRRGSVTSASAFRKAVTAVLFSLAMVLPAQAGDSGGQERARRALEAGEILPLREILQRIERDTPGQVIEVELEREGGRWVYEIKLLAAGGAIVELEVDARDATVLRRKGGRKHERQKER